MNFMEVCSFKRKLYQTVTFQSEDEICSMFTFTDDNHLHLTDSSVWGSVFLILLYTRLELAALVNLTPQTTIFALSDLTPHCHSAVRNLGMIFNRFFKMDKQLITFYVKLLNCLRDGTEVNKITVSPFKDKYNGRHWHMFMFPKSSRSALYLLIIVRYWSSIANGILSLLTHTSRWTHGYIVTLVL